MPFAISMITLGVSNLAESVAFYRDTLRFELQGQSGEFAFFNGGPVSLVLNVGLGKAVQPRAGAMEVILAVPGVRAAYAELLERGAEFQIQPRVVNGTSWAATLADPDGHRLTLYGPE
jgi:catechol 2,3-dioxygenase-like lactoylglutathione lyase family enzyme